MLSRGRIRRFVSETTAGSLGVLAVAYLVFWGCAWSSARSTYAPAAMPLPPTPAASADAAPSSEVGVSLLPALPTSAGAVWLSHDLDRQYQVFGGVGVSGGLLGAGATPFGGLRLMFDPVENLRLGLEVSAALEAGYSFGGIVSASQDGVYALPSVGVGMPLAWQFMSWEMLDSPWTLSLYTNPGVALGPAWGQAVVVAYANPDRLAALRLPIGLGLTWDRFRFFLETGGQGAGAIGDRFVLLPIPFPYLSGGASFAF
jgi:hypothetical protein